MISKLHVYFRTKDFLRYKNQLFYGNLKKIQESQKRYNAVHDKTEKSLLLDKLKVFNEREQR